MGWHKLALAIACLTSGCSVPPTPQAIDNSAKVSNVTEADNMEVAASIDVERLKSENARLAIENEELKRMRASGISTASTETDVEAQSMCYKDYCPCEKPQGGPDMLLCDQLEQGIEVDIQMMIAGRSMREVRRQLATGDY